MKLFETTHPDTHKHHDARITASAGISTEKKRPQPERQRKEERPLFVARPRLRVSSCAIPMWPSSLDFSENIQVRKNMGINKREGGMKVQIGETLPTNR